jgi:hypothetical protein
VERDEDGNAEVNRNGGDTDDNEDKGGDDVSGLAVF